MIFTFFYYLLFASSVLLYGIGLNRSTLVTHIVPLFGLILKNIFSVVATSVLTYLFIEYLLLPLNLVELYPLVAFLIFSIIAIFFETVVRITSAKVTSEFCLSFLIVILSLNEGFSILDVILINITCFLSFILLLPFLKVIKKHNSLVGNIQPHVNYKTLLLISIAVLIMALAVFNVSWLNVEVLK